MCQHSIANIDINKDYDESLGLSLIHICISFAT